MSCCARLKCSTSCHGEWSSPLGTAPRRAGGMPFTAASKLTWASPQSRSLLRWARSAWARFTWPLGNQHDLAHEAQAAHVLLAVDLRHTVHADGVGHGHIHELGPQADDAPAPLHPRHEVAGELRYALADGVL